MAKHLPSVSLIISTYKWPEALELILLSVMKQSHMPNEVIIADDGSGGETKNMIQAFQKKLKVSLKHVWHQDTGFTITIIFNKAIAVATSDYIVQIGGDVILHKHFIKDHLRFAQPNSFINGSRVLILENKVAEVFRKKIIHFSPFSIGIKNHLNAIHLPILTPLLFQKQYNIDAIRGCNTSFWKKDFDKINGYNEDILGWGREDSELAARFINNGIPKRQLKLAGIQYHIHHPFVKRDKLERNDEIQDIALKNNIKYCKNGLRKLGSEITESAFIKSLKTKISGVIITYNEEEKIAKCIQSLEDVVDEIVVVDSFSTDRTEDICKKHGVRFIKNKFEGHIEQKNFAITQAKYDHVLSLDADEILSAELKESILSTKNNFTFDGYSMNRRNFYCGKKIKHSGWYPDIKIRLFNRNKGQWGGENPHDEVVMENKKHTKHLGGDLLHYTFNTVQEHEQQMKKFARISANFKYENKNQREIVHLKTFISPIYRFLNLFFLKKGFLDGKEGFKICYEEAKYTFRKYNLLRKLYKNGKK